MKRLGLLVVALVLGAFADLPHLTFEASSTNVVLSEQVTVRIALRLPPLEGELADTPPYISQQPPHFDAAFMEPDWKPKQLEAIGVKEGPPIAVRRKSRREPAYTLNRYSQSMFSGFGGFDEDPFGMLDDDFFGSIHRGPRLRQLPFTAIRRVKQAGTNAWEFLLEVGPYKAIAKGKVNFGQVKVNYPRIVGVRSARDRFGRAVQVPDVREVILRSPPLVVEVVEPPSEGRPASWCGAIASNFVAKASLSAQVCTAGDPLTLTLDMTGVEDLSTLTAPAISKIVEKGGAFRLDEASLKTEMLTGLKRFTWRVRPIKAGTVDFPSLDVGWYDLSKRAYAVIHTGGIPIQIKAGQQAALGALDETLEDGETYPMPDGISLDVKGAGYVPLLPHLWLCVVLFVGAPLLFTVIRLAPPVRRRVAARQLERRRAGAYAKCARVLRRSRDAEAKVKAVRRFFEERYGVNGGTVTAMDARRLMGGDFAEEEIAAVEVALNDFDRTSFAARKVVTMLVVALVALGAGAASPDFTWRRAGALATQATDAAGFRRAAAAYADCAKAGASTAALYLNLGTCALMGENARGALAAFSRAERLEGESAASRRGTKATMARLKADARADLPLARSFFRPHVLYPLDVRLMFAAVCWALLWLLALLPAGGVRRFLMGVCMVALLAGAISSGVSLVAEHFAREVEYVAK